MRRGLLNLVVLFALAAVLAGCGGGDRSILYKGVAGPAGGPRMVISDAAALRDGKAIRKRWLADIARAGREYPKRRFHNLPASRLRARLATAAGRYHFTVKRVQFLHPRQVAPLVIVQTHHYRAMARAFGAILYKSLDPIRRHRCRDRCRPAETFEAFFFEAQDERGVPFIIVSYDARGRGAGGGMWARSEELYPGPHG
jgi:hypothetical protein